MDLQTFLDQAMAKQRQDDLSNSNQLLLGELILKLQAIKDKTKPIIFDFGMKPGRAMSWRGSYCEMAIEYSEEGGGTYSWNSTEKEEWSDEKYKSYKQEKNIIPQAPTTKDFLEMLETVLNKEMTGYKGGNFKMHKGVAVYVANYSESGIENYKGNEFATVAIFDVNEEEDAVTIKTDEIKD